MSYYLAIALGGAVGAVARYWLSSWVERFNSGVFPAGTATVNLVGSLLIGFLFVLLLERIQLATVLRPLLISGFLGAFTTFSTFSLDALLLLQQGYTGTALTYLAASVVGCLLAAWLGMGLGRLFV